MVSSAPALEKSALSAYLDSADCAADFDSIATGAQWLAIPGFICTVVLLLSFAFLPVQRTSRHYLTICLIVAIFVLELAYIVPLGAKPKQCYDPITPNNMGSDLTCAFSGAFLLFGGFGGVVWVFIRSLSVHLQICWQVVPADLFFYAAQIGGWGLTILFTALALGLSGVSYRLGSTCYINHVNSIGSYWVPLLVLAGCALVLQITTFAYCVRVYLSVAGGPKGLPSSNISGLNGTGTATTTSSGRSVIVKRARYRRVRKVIALQWRGMTVVVLVLITVVYLATVFLMLDQDISRAYDDVKQILPWVICMVQANGNKTKCTPLTSDFVLQEQAVLPIPYLIVMCGFYCLLFLGRWGMVVGWRELIMRPASKGSRGSDSLRSRSQQSFQERMQSTPQQLHIIKNETGLSVARKCDSMDIEMVVPPPSARPRYPQEEEEEEEEFYTPRAVDYERHHDTHPAYRPTAPIPRALSPRSPPVNTQAGFNFSRPASVQRAHTSSPTYPRPLVTLNHHSRQQYHTDGRPQRSASNASESWLMHDQGPISNTSPAVPARSASRATNQSRSASRTDNQPIDSRASQGMAWDPAESFAAPVDDHDRMPNGNRNQNLNRTYSARGYSHATGYR